MICFSPFFFGQFLFSSFSTLGVWHIVFSINSASFQPFLNLPNSHHVPPILLFERSNHRLLAFLFLVILSVRLLMLLSVYFLIHSLSCYLSFIRISKRVSLYHHPPIIMVIQYHHSFFQQHLHFFSSRFACFIPLSFIWFYITFDGLLVLQ